MDKKYIIQLKMEDKRIANCLYDYEGFLSVIKRVSDIIYNYNQNLASLRWPRHLLGFRILEEENRDGNLRTKKPVLKENSYKRLINDHYDVDIQDPNKLSDSTGLIGIENNDRWRNEDMANYKVIIDFDRKIINFSDFVLYYTRDEYEKDMSRKVSCGMLNFFEADVDSLPFNELENVYNFVKENKDGWKTETYSGTMMCCVPYSA